MPRGGGNIISVELTFTYITFCVVIIIIIMIIYHLLLTIIRLNINIASISHAILIWDRSWSILVQK